VGFHGTDSGGERSPVSVELYDNVFHNDSANTKRAVTNRGGTAVYFNNTYEGTAGWYGLYLYYYRSSYYQSSMGNWGMCDGTQYDLGSSDLSSDDSRRTVPANTGVRFLAANPETISASGTRYFDGNGSYGYPGRDQPGIGPGQVLAPIYAWNNGSVVVVVGDADIEAPAPASNWIAENREYYNYVPSGFDGSVGVGRGLLSARPASGLTAGVGYFATDTNTLYVATNATTWVSYYTPYTYPHPLQG
jgi:hypothetical protein